MIQTYSTTIRRKEMDAVLTCMVDEKIGPGELNAKLITQIKEFIKCDGAIALRSPAIALNYALMSMGLESGSKVMVSALAPAWQYQSLVSLGFEPLVLDVDELNGLVNEQIISEGIKQGGKVLLLHETEGILPNLEEIVKLGVPIIEDISQSAGSAFSMTGDDGSATLQKMAGTFGVYSILGLEEKDVITAGGGAVLISPGRREWIVLKKYVDEAPLTDLLPDINAALAWVQVKEFARNEKTRKELFAMYQQACFIGRHKMYARENENGSTACSFPLVLSSSYKDVKQYAAKKDIEINLAYENSIIALKDELSETCIHAKSLYLRCVHIPLYPRLTHAESSKIIKVLSSLP
ncbi:MAG: DegT/DnrJ/EryC1/StrS family aminotransferase [Treponema sp.]|nr:DegT/DnrJ/EryC1/StrS family aminotransferase [Spirochaetales bacterium]MDY5918220.1 DegT/DnrJ/EryC1/StrS family aminotransferase [Treponema sp.]MDY6188996.1 DegT/DnrJ/EryC1/StrS family aminotransferase [Treponema sp.]